MDLNNLKRAFLSPLIEAVPLSLSRWVSSCNLIIVYYHVVSDAPLPHIENLYRYKNVRKFTEDLDFLLKNYSPVELSEVIQWVRGDRTLAPDSFLLTFDDGLSETHDIIAPILSEKGIPATFFVSSAFLDNRELCYLHKISLLADHIKQGISPHAEREVRGMLIEMGLPGSPLAEEIGRVHYKQRDRLDAIAELLGLDFQEYLSATRPYLTSEEVREMIRKGFTIGSHSIDHPYYSDLSLKDQLFQTVTSTMEIRQRFELDYGAFAFPHNDLGVSREFFDKIEENGLIDISFGTGGMLKGALERHRQRVSLEDPSLTAKEILAWEYTRRIYYQMRKKSGAH